jgi:hypothetical protein
MSKTNSKLVQVVVSGVPKEIVDEIDRAALSEDRTRAAEIRRILTDAMSARLTRQKTAKAA